MARRIKEEPEVHQNRIASCAAKIFSDNGIKHTTMDDIARAAGYSKATLYVYFKNKEDIVNYLSYESMAKLRDVLDKACKTTEDAEEGFFSICFALNDFYEEYPDFFDRALMYIAVDKSGDGSMLNAVYEIGEDINKIIENFILSGVRKGQLIEPDDYFETILHMWAMISGVIKFAKEKEEYIFITNGALKEDFLRRGFLKIYKTIQK